MERRIETAVRASNFYIFYMFYRGLAEHMEGVQRHIDFGHAKELRFIKSMAGMFKRRDFVYYDHNEDFISQIQTKSKNLVLTTSPKGFFDSASYFLTIHDFFGTGQSPEGTLKEAYGFLSPGRKIFVIDYDLSWVRDRVNPEEILKRIFHSGNEQKVAQTEKNWFDAHTKYNLAQCVSDAEEVGFSTLHQERKGEKLFLYVGQK